MTAAIMASVLPQVTTISPSGSIGRPMKWLCLAASALRRFGAPQVTAYWWKSSCATCSSRLRIVYRVDSDRLR